MEKSSKEVEVTPPVVLTDMDYADGISLHSDNVEQVLKSGVFVTFVWCPWGNARTLPLPRVTMLASG